jgi:hypothetical protein
VEIKRVKVFRSSSVNVTLYFLAGIIVLLNKLRAVAFPAKNTRFVIVRQNIFGGPLGR